MIARDLAVRGRIARSSAALAITATTLAASPATAERAIHGSVGAGGSFVMTGSQGDRFRLDLQLDLKPRSRYGVLVGWRAFDGDRRGLVTAGLLYEGAAARPTLVLDLHADIGVDLDQRAPLVGGGIRPTLQLIGPLGLVYDGGAYLVIDGVNNSRLQLMSTLLLVARW